METVLVVVFLLSIVALLMGMIRPHLVVRAKRGPATRRRVLALYGTIAMISLVAVGMMAEEAKPADETGDESTSEAPVSDVIDGVRSWSTCELIWAKISNADLDRERPRETDLKELARAYDCGARPSSVPRKEYPEAREIQDPPMPEYAVRSYQQAYSACSVDTAHILAEAKTEDPQEAARWYSTLITSDAALVEGGYRGCLDALTGNPNKHRKE